MIMRDILNITESVDRPPPGMLAVKQRLSNDLDMAAPDDEEDDAFEHGSLLKQWGIIDDCWITENGGLMLYRQLILEKPWMKALQRQGHCCWSTSAMGAHAYNHSEAKAKRGRKFCSLPS